MIRRNDPPEYVMRRRLRRQRQVLAEMERAVAEMNQKALEQERQYRNARNVAAFMASLHA